MSPRVFATDLALAVGLVQGNVAAQAGAGPQSRGNSSLRPKT